MPRRHCAPPLGLTSYESIQMGLPPQPLCFHLFPKGFARPLWCAIASPIPHLSLSHMRSLLCSHSVRLAANAYASPPTQLHKAFGRDSVTARAHETLRAGKCNSLSARELHDTLRPDALAATSTLITRPASATIQNKLEEKLAGRVAISSTLASFVAATAAAAASFGRVLSSATVKRAISSEGDHPAVRISMDGDRVPSRSARVCDWLEEGRERWHRRVSRWTRLGFGKGREVRPIDAG